MKHLWEGLVARRVALVLKEKAYLDQTATESHAGTGINGISMMGIKFAINERCNINGESGSIQMGKKPRRKRVSDDLNGDLLMAEYIFDVLVVRVVQEIRWIKKKWFGARRFGRFWVRRGRVFFHRYVVYSACVVQRYTYFAKFNVA